MSKHQKILDIKSDILSLCVNSVEELNSLSEYFDMLRKFLTDHFDIERSSVLVHEANVFTCVKGDLFTRDEGEDFPWSLFEPYFANSRIVNIPYFISEHQKYKDMTQMVLFQYDKHKPSAVLLVQETDKWLEFINLPEAKDVLALVSRLTYIIRRMLLVRVNESRFRKLYNMTELFHSSMDIDLILQNVLMTIKENFPALEAELILSNDQDRLTTVNIKPFDYLSERPSTIEAFVSGEVTFEKAPDLGKKLLNAPIKGRQAIYGILQVSVPKMYHFYDEQKEFIRMLAQASGNALENAKLYHQSHRLVSDLQLINETSHRLNMKLDIEEMLSFLQKQLIKSFQPKELAFVLNDNYAYVAANFNSEFFLTDDGKLYIQHIEKHFAKTQDPLFIADFSRLIAQRVKYKSMIAIPMVMEERVSGYTIILHTDPYFFSFDSFKLMQSLIHHSSLAIANSILQVRLQEMVDRDHLTKLYARSYLDGFVEKSLKNDESGMFMLIDIDNFKKVNDTYGHQVGDEVLMQIGNKLQSLIGTRGVCARWGGEEMSVYISNILPDEAERIAQNIVDEIPKSTNPRVTISAGLILWHKSQRPEFQSVFLQADTALYSAKHNGKNQVCLFDDSMQLQK